MDELIHCHGVMYPHICYYQLDISAPVMLSLILVFGDYEDLGGKQQASAERWQNGVALGFKSHLWYWMRSQYPKKALCII